MLLEGEHRGLSVLSASPCYLTDQRNFSNEMRARSRMQSVATLDFTNSKPGLTQSHRCGDLIECDPVSGEVLRQRQGSTSNMKFLLAAAEPTILIRMDCKYTDPLAAAAHGIGEIEYKGSIEIDPTARTIDIDVMICLFPAFEGYAKINDGFPAILFRHAPPAGILPLGPPRGANRRIRSRLEDRGDSGLQAPAAET